MKIYKSSYIKQINNIGIVFIDGFNISFKESAENFKLYNNANFSCCVAERNILSKKPYFIFYTNDKTIVYINGITKKIREKRFNDLKSYIEQFGYTTYDLT